MFGGLYYREILHKIGKHQEDCILGYKLPDTFSLSIREGLEPLVLKYIKQFSQIDESHHENLDHSSIPQESLGSEIFWINPDLLLTMERVEIHLNQASWEHNILV